MRFVLSDWLALAREVAKRRWTVARRVSPAELRRMVPAWLRRSRSRRRSGAVTEGRRKARAQWLRKWLRWEAETEARYRAHQAQADVHQGMTLAEWKQYDNEQLARYERIRQADLAFDAEVEEPLNLQNPSLGITENSIISSLSQIPSDSFSGKVLGWQYTPLLAGAVSVLATDAAFVLLVVSPQPFGWATALGALSLWLIGRFAGLIGTIATGYQYSHHLHCTTQADTIIADALFGLSFIPKPDFSVTNHVALLYTAYTTWIRPCSDP